MTIEEASANPTMQPREMVATLKRISRRGDANWDDWVRLGIAIVERQHIASRKAGGTTRGPIYAERLSDAMGQFYDDYKRLSDNGTVSALARCIEELAAVNAWRSRAAVENRLSSPRRVWDGYQESLRSSTVFADMDDDFEDSEDKKPAWKRKTNATRKPTAEQFNEVLYRLEQQNMTGSADDTAANLWQQFLTMFANDERLAAAHLDEVIRALQAIRATVTGAAP